MNAGIINCRKCVSAIKRVTHLAGMFSVLSLALLFALSVGASAQSALSTAGGLRGQVSDPTGAVIPGATIVVRTTSGTVAAKTASDATGAYSIHGLQPGKYSVWVTAQGFAEYSVAGVRVLAGQIHTLNPTLVIQVQQQQVQVHAENNTISTAPDNNASALVIKGSELNALSDDPDELQNELQALAGPSAGPNGGEIYIDGFTGGQLPPKSAIREIRINQNPFSAEYDRLGYGRIEIFTKPGSDHLHGEVHTAGNYSSLNSQNPLLQNQIEPSYYTWFMHGSVGGPISKNASYFASGFGMKQEDVNVLRAQDPVSISAGNTTAPSVNEAFSYPNSRMEISPRVDVQLGQANTLTARWEYGRDVANDSLGGSALTLPSQATNEHDVDNTIQLSDSLLLTKNLVDDIRFQYRRVNDTTSAVSSAPAFSLQGTFSDGGNSEQTVKDRENDFEVQNYFSAAEGAHSLNFGARVRVYSDWNYTNSGSNGSYTFSDPSDFAGCYQSTYTTAPAPSTCQPSQYSYTQVVNPVAQATLFDGALFYQDDWKVSPRFTFSYGLRWETQNHISDKSDFAPRIMLAYALGHSHGNKPAKTVVRAGYGWFYNRFTVPDGFGGQVPYVIQTIHDNGTNEQQFVQNASSGGSSIPFYQYVSHPITSGTDTQAATTYSISPNFHAALDMEAAAGVDQQLTKYMTGNVTYIYSQGIHQFFTDDLSAAGEFPLQDAQNDTYPSSISTPLTDNLQYQSEGFYKENQVMVTVRANYRMASVFTSYTWSHALGDTSGVGSVPSASDYPSLDYGRTSFDVPQRFLLFGNFQLPWKISISPMMMANSGSPYNVTIGSDLTGNNQFDARPTYAASCSESGAVSTQFGCLDTTPVMSGRTGEKIIPYGVGTGPTNVSMNMRVAKIIGIGPKVGKGKGAEGGGGYHGGRGMHGGLSGSSGGPGHMDQGVSRKYSLTLEMWGTNVLNHTNLGTPNGVIRPTLNSAGVLTPSNYFGTSQSLAGGFFGHSSAGNRILFLSANFAF